MIGIALGVAALAVAAPAVPASAAPAGGDCELLAVPAAGNARHLAVTEVCGTDAAAARRAAALIELYYNPYWAGPRTTIWGDTCTVEGFNVAPGDELSRNISSWRPLGECRKVVAYNREGVAKTFYGPVGDPGESHNDNIARMRISA
ncbi:hypothetical protein GCM10010123_05140 [Pilimelia anulata]|uniref:Uncharacterized protein n=2 Tax=Pilimelia anulata TaxID=53371 RepID=A0A8J3B6P7_9ACTN|nr:hypothetical protein GCM10010123_05140 [Pilimelia anulata]